MQTSPPTPASPHSGPETLDGVLRCVSSGYLADGCSCHATVPANVVRAAWTRERAAGAGNADGFFTFPWRGRAWLSYGLRSGEVRGVYCPEHRARRAERLGAREARAA